MKTKMNLGAIFKTMLLSPFVPIVLSSGNKIHTY